MEELPQGKIYLIPVRLDNVTPSHDSLSDIHWVNLFEDWDQGVHQIMKAICFDYFKDRIPTEDFTAVDLEQILKNISELLPTKLSSKKYQLIFSNYSTNPIVLGNKAMLTLVFCNVITNAIDFSMPKDMISRIEVFIKLYENGPWMFVQVQNHGQPIDEKDIIYGRIFKPFFTTSSKGIGLGLAVTKMVVEKHGGTIFVISTPTMSSSFEKAQSNLFCTTFAITLPRIINCKK